MATYKERVALFEHVLRNRVIDFERLRRLCYRGIPETKGIRQKCWKLLLNYLPSDTLKWPTILAAKRQIYAGFVKDFCTPPPSEPTGDASFPSPSPAHSEAPLPSDPLSATVDPLAIPPASVSQSALTVTQLTSADRDLLDTIDKDVRRTLPSMAFFHNQVFELPSNTLPPRHTFLQSGDSHDKNFHAVERILYVFAKLNPGIGYIQGMNHVVFPIYYLLASDDDFDGKANAEADAFFLFHEVMTDYRDLFMDGMDSEVTGINSAMDRFAQRLGHLDPDLWSNLSGKGLQPAFFSFRWITCLCAQEFTVPDLLRLWDSLFADRLAARNRGRNEASDLRRQINGVDPSGGPPPPLRTASGDALTAALLVDAGAAFGGLDDDDESVHSTRRGGFLPDFMAALVLHRRSELMRLAFDEGLLLLQQQPAAELDYLLRETYRIVLIGDPDSPNAGTEDGGGASDGVAGWMRRVGAAAGLSLGTGASSVASPPISRKTSSESMHGRSRSFSSWSWNTTGAVDQQQQHLGPEPGSTNGPVRRLMHRQSQSFSAMSGMVWGKLRSQLKSASTSPERGTDEVQSTPPAAAAATVVGFQASATAK